MLCFYSPVVTKEDQGEADVLEFVVVIELEVFVEYMKTMVAVLTQGINLEIHPNQTRRTTLEASESQNQAEGIQEADIWFHSPNLDKVEMKVFVGETF